MEKRLPRNIAAEEVYNLLFGSTEFKPEREDGIAPYFRTRFHAQQRDEHEGLQEGVSGNHARYLLYKVHDELLPLVHMRLPHENYFAYVRSFSSNWAHLIISGILNSGISNEQAKELVTEFRGAARIIVNNALDAEPAYYPPDRKKKERLIGPWTERQQQPETEESHKEIEGRLQKIIEEIDGWEHRKTKEAVALKGIETPASEEEISFLVSKHSALACVETILDQASSLKERTRSKLRDDLGETVNSAETFLQNLSFMHGVNRSDTDRIKDTLRQIQTELETLDRNDRGQQPPGRG